MYVDPEWSAKALAEPGGDSVANQPAVWLDSIGAIHANLRIVTVIEPDSLPNLVTSTGARQAATLLCETMLANGGYVDGVGPPHRGHVRYRGIRRWWYR